ncbi:hypothetical protein [Microbacterium sp. A1-JK]|uniref:hypothetical protein n=1 Tax=Microbacterium sp. A1-JK TaxID=3177516 RepID=UPI003888F3B8
MNAVRYIALGVFLAVMALYASGHRSWWALGVAVVAAAALFWACGAFDRNVWFGSDEVDAECAAIDQELAEHDRIAEERPRHLI